MTYRAEIVSISNLMGCQGVIVCNQGSNIFINWRVVFQSYLNFSDTYFFSNHVILVQFDTAHRSVLVS